MSANDSLKTLSTLKVNGKKNFTITACQKQLKNSPEQQI